MGNDLVGKKLGILGFGKEGKAVATFLKANGLVAEVFDEKPRSAFPELELKAWEDDGFRFLFEDWTQIVGWDIAFRSPGIKRLTENMEALERQGVEISSQTIYFFKHSPARIVGVTGTKGKGTTASLVYEMLKLQYPGQVWLTGNIGKVDPLELLPKLEPEHWVVFELSSFQLQDLKQSPQIGVCLMVTCEHLDFHKDLGEYHKAKESISTYQTAGDSVVYAVDYPASLQIGLQGQGDKFAFSRYHPVDRGAYAKGEEIVLVGTPVDGVIDVSKRKLLGHHNLENIAAATAAAALAGVGLTHIQKAVESFNGLEHRLEYVGRFGEVDFYNDSISTTPDSTVAAVEAFTAPLVLILGGSEKWVDFEAMAMVLAKQTNIRAIILVGQAAPRIDAALKAAGFTVPCFYGASNMDEIFGQIKQVVKPSDVVLLSPACASFGMFQNYAERGEQFKRLARQFTL